MTDWLQWAAIVGLFVFVCFARGSAVDQARRELRAYDERLSESVGRLRDGFRRRIR